MQLLLVSVDLKVAIVPNPQWDRVPHEVGVPVLGRRISLLETPLEWPVKQERSFWMRHPMGSSPIYEEGVG